MSYHSDKNNNNRISITKIDNGENNENQISSDIQTSAAAGGIQRDFAFNKLNMLRSPSRESVGTDISLFSVSTIASELPTRVKLLSVKMPHENVTIVSRGQSPNPNSDYKISNRPENIQEVWFEESNDMIKGMAVLSSVIGFSKSFSTSDITNLSYYGGGGVEEDIGNGTRAEENCTRTLFSRRNAVSELGLNIFQKSNYILEQNAKLENASRSCSTWVAVGDIPSTSQLPSPHDGSIPPALLSSNRSSCVAPTFTASDFIRSVNKKVRQKYIRRRLMNTYKALERLSQSEFNLDKLEMAAIASRPTKSGTAGSEIAVAEKQNMFTGFDVQAKKNHASNRLSVPGVSTNIRRQWKSIKFIDTNEERLTVNDVERERGQPLSKYDRNMMIFNWLLTLESDENSTDSSTYQ